MLHSSKITLTETYVRNKPQKRIFSCCCLFSSHVCFHFDPGIAAQCRFLTFSKMTKTFQLLWYFSKEPLWFSFNNSIRISQGTIVEFRTHIFSISLQPLIREQLFYCFIPWLLVPRCRCLAMCVRLITAVMGPILLTCITFNPSMDK